MRGLTRRQLAAVFGTLPLAAQQNPPTPAEPKMPAADSLAKAVDSVRDNGMKLRAMNVPMDVEPAFRFQA